MTIFFNAFHSPVGAHASFTLGCRGQSGGLGLEMGGPAQENVYIGLQSQHGDGFEALPFFDVGEDAASRYDHADSEGSEDQKSIIQSFDINSISRQYATGTDTWQAGDLTFKIYSHALSAPCPETSSTEEQKRAYCPTVIAELIVDNRSCDHDRKAIFGYMAGNSTDSMQIMGNLPASFTGLAKGNSTAIITDSSSVIPAQGFSADDILQETEPLNYHFGLGDTGLLIFNTGANELSAFRIAICFFRGGIVTSGESTSYWYKRFFNTIEETGVFALENVDFYKNAALETDKKFDAAHLNNHQRFQLSHAIRSYYGSTQLLDWDGKPFWVVNEGEYRMMNTFDLTVDQLFFEMKQNPWTVKNELDMFSKRYSYTDKLHFPGGDNEYEGGISFTHDMGRCNHISRTRHSAYELFNLTGCFSHMTHEQLVNWVLCASVYASQSRDDNWLQINLSTFVRCLESMLNRDNPEPAGRNGIMALDSSRTVKGAEITTYDSLDESLGQARNNVYLAVKCWASYVAMADIFKNNKLEKEAETALTQADLTAATISSYLTDDGYIPAIMGEDCESRIIPAIEGLVFPYVLGHTDALAETGRYGNLIKALKSHFITILQKGICLYDDNGWKLSSSADNSWLSKIYLSQFVARQLFSIKTPETGELADEAHYRWLLKDENLFFAWSDQMVSGVAKGSKYYPRGVTSVLWLLED